MKTVAHNEDLTIRINKTHARFKRIRNPEGRDEGVGTFLFVLHVTATVGPLFIPMSIASGKKPTGFVYQIEGTGEGTIATTDLSVRGAGVTQITLGTIRYVKIPAGKTATFRIVVEMRGWVGEAYSVVIYKVHYKRDVGEARYQKYTGEVRSKSATFR